MFIDFFDDILGFKSQARGSDGRVNTSSRSDSRRYYNARDKGETYTLVFDDADAAVNDFIVYLKNTDTNKQQLVVSSVGINSTVSGTFKFHRVTGTASGGSTLTPCNTNFTSSNEANAVARGNGAIGDLTSSGVHDQLIVGTLGHEEFRFGDVIRLGQGDAIAIEFDRGTGNTIAEGTVFFYFEPKGKA